MKIYTKTGDKGETGLFGGKRVSKDDVRIEAYGTTDELNAFIGQLISQVEIDDVQKVLIAVQNDIFAIGSMLSMPADQSFDIPIVDEASIEILENAIDNMESGLEPLRNFILPSGHATISACHICRTVSRRAERRVVTLESVEEIDPTIKKYLNRLSDYFFVLSRYIAANLGINETIWKPKK